MTQPTPPPRCRVLVEGKVCGEIAAHGIHDPAEGHHPFDDLERRVRGERRKQNTVASLRPSDQMRRNNLDRRKGQDENER